VSAFHSTVIGFVRPSFMRYHGINISDRYIADFCKRHRIRRLALFGSILRDDFRPDRDIDMLVEFEPEAHVGLFGLERIQRELSEAIGRKVDLNTPGFLSDRFRERVLAEAEDQYVAA
jgi:predicted nucleotidyltransferase